MAYIKLDHKKVRKLMLRDRLRPADLAKMLGKDRQTINYMLNWGGRKYAIALAEIFGCAEKELLVESSRN